MNWNQRLTQARIAKGINKLALAKLVGVSAATVTQWENGTIKALAGTNLVKVSEALGVSTEYLQNGTTSRDTLLDPSLPRPASVAVRDEDDQSFVAVRMVKLRLSAGIMGFQAEPAYEADSVLKMSRRWIERNSFNLEHLIAITVHGESMEPSLYDGDVVVINTLDKNLMDSAVFAVNYEGEAVVKRMSRDAGDWWRTSDNADNRRFPRKVCRGLDCMVVGRVVWREGSRV